MSPPTLVILDCDGVLVDSEPIADAVFAAALDDIGIDRSPAELGRAFRGRRLDECLETVARWRGAPLPEDFREQLQARTFARFRRELRPIPGVVAALERLRAMPVTLCVASSGEPEKLALTLGLTGLDTYFGGRVFSATAVARGKPAPDLFLHAARACAADPAACVVVEDSRPGMEAGLAAGMQVLGYVPEAAQDASEDSVPAGVVAFAAMDALPELVEAGTADWRKRRDASS